jgi:hypothetical protein
MHLEISLKNYVNLGDVVHDGWMQLVEAYSAKLRDPELGILFDPGFFEP